MKLESDTLYQQWRNLTSFCPERCDPRWIDLALTPIDDPQLLTRIQTVQHERQKYAKFGYAWFITEMAELVERDPYAVIPRIGASHMALKYQMPQTPEGGSYFFDYFIVPKISRLSSAYVCPDEGFSPVRRSGRFIPSNYARSAVDFNLEDLARRIAEEGEDWYRLQRDYETDIPLPDEAPRRRRRNQAENQWIDLNLLASYRFNKGSVQVLYAPSDLKLMRAQLPYVKNYWQDSEGRTYVKREYETKGKRVKKLWDADGDHSFSEPVMVTATVVLQGGPDLSPLGELTDAEMPSEEFTDMVTDRKVVDDAKLDARKKIEAEDDQLDREFNPYRTFIFSKYAREVIGESDPFLAGRYLNFIKTWVVKVYDASVEGFVAKTLNAWQADCRIDRVPLVPIEKIPALLLRGLTPDQIIVLSSQLGEGVPEDQEKAIVDKFIREEIELRIR